MFDNLNLWEFVGLLLLALLIFGERLPKVISDGMRMLRNLRRMATNATGDLSRELGTEVRLEDLNPKTFLRKHVLSEEDEAALRKPWQSVMDDVKADATGLRENLDVRSTFDLNASGDKPAAKAPVTRASFDDAT